MPPAGVQANFDNPDSIAWKVHITAVVCGVTVALLVAMQVYTRLCIHKSKGWDDSKSFAYGTTLSTDLDIVASAIATVMFVFDYRMVSNFCTAVGFIRLYCPRRIRYSNKNSFVLNGEADDLSRVQQGYGRRSWDNNSATLTVKQQPV